MFTGIIQSTGQIESIEQTGGDKRFRIRCPDLGLDGTGEGDSISVNGVCLTAIALSDDAFSADVSSETLGATTLGQARPGSRINLERSLTLSTPLGGHLVTGHVDARGRILGRRQEARSVRFDIAAPDSLARYIARKGSICLDGVSLTVNEVQGAEFDVNIIPHTMEVTTLGAWQTGDSVNIEVDLIARYAERLLVSGTDTAASASGGISRQLLEDYGFGKDC